MIDLRSHGLLIGLIILVGLARPAAAFGAGNIASISKVEGQNWRHGDIEDALLTLTMARAWNGKKFNKLMVSRTYFGNWLRDYSQAVDVGTVKSVSAEAIRLLLCVLGFLTFGYGSGEFEVTAARLGCYRPEDHIDNPKDYADNQDARQYDRRLRGPIDERRELSIDPETGLKNYIANERAGIMTSAQHVRKLFGGCIELGRRYKHRGDKKDLYEALRLMGTGLHCLEDYFAHSNYCELALIEMGERDVFPHVGRRTQMQIQGARGPVYPIVTGTFGGVDFLHSVVGEVSDKMTQNEIQELEGTLKESSNADTSMLRELLDNIPDGLFGDKNQSQKVDEIQANAAQSQVQNMSISPREPEEFTRYIEEVYTQVMPVIEFHDDIMKSITSAIEKIPVLPKIIEQLEDQLSQFVFSIIAPFVVPLIDQIKSELQTGSDEIINSSSNEQHVVWNNDSATDPTHSMLAKDHFSNILNEVAGQSAAKMVHWVVPQLMDAIDNEETDINRLLDRIIHGIMAHPAQRDLGQDGARDGRQLMFQAVQEWWGEMGDDQRQDYRRKLSREGVENGENHKEGVYDTGHGHGCTGKLKMRKLYGEPQTFEDKIAGAAAGAIFSGATGVISGLVEQETGFNMPSQGNSGRNDDGPLGGFLSGQGGGDSGGLGGLLGAATSMLGGSFGGEDQEEDRRPRKEGGFRQDPYQESRNEEDEHKARRHKKKSSRGSSRSRSRSRDRSGSRRREHSRHRAEDGYERRTEREYGHSGDTYDQTERTERRYPDGSSETQYSRYEQQDSNYGREASGYGYEERTETRPSGRGYESTTERREYGGSTEQSYGGNSYGRGEAASYGGGGGGEYGRGEESSYGGGGSYGRSEESSYGRGEAASYGGGGGGEYGRGEESSYGGGGGYGRGEAASYGGGEYGNSGGYGGGQEREEGGYGENYEQRESDSYGRRREEGGYGGGYGGGGGY